MMHLQRICFDYHFPWHMIETLGLSIQDGLTHVANLCDVQNSFILDGWHLSDISGVFLPENCSVYVVYAPYDAIIDQYRIPVLNRAMHKKMFDKWYRFDYQIFPQVRFILNQGGFVETSFEQFCDTIS